MRYSYIYNLWIRILIPSNGPLGRTTTAPQSDSDMLGLSQVLQHLPKLLVVAYVNRYPGVG